MHETKLLVTADTLVIQLHQWHQNVELVIINEFGDISVNGVACETRITPEFQVLYILITPT